MGLDMLTAKRLRDVLNYDPSTGVFTWKVNHPRAAQGAKAGAKDAHGYVVIRVDKILYKAHRLAWLYAHGAWPVQSIDHINRVRDDNRISNLRDVGQSENTLNGSLRRANKSGATGVRWDSLRQRWVAGIKVRYRAIHLGRYNTKEEAVAARKAAEAQVLNSIKF